MARVPDKNLITALDIGTSKVVAIVAEVTDYDKIHVIGVGVQPSSGLKKGVIVNIDATALAIQKAIEEAEHMADCDISSVCVGISGSHIRSFNSNGIVAIRNQEVSDADIDRVIEAAKAVAIPNDLRVLHILPQEFVVDNQDGLKEPVGMSGVRLEAKVHMICGSVSAAQNIIKCINHCGVDGSDMVLQQLASSYAVLTEDEKELGVCLVDIGGGTTDVAVFVDGAIKHTAVIPIAGTQITNDIAHALRAPTQYAESIKVQYGKAMGKLAKPDESIEVKGAGDRPGRRLSMQALASVIEARYEELFNMIVHDLEQSGFADAINAGIVLTGGSSKMDGVLQLAEEVFQMPVRLGTPQSVTGMKEVINDPIHSTGVGLLLYTHSQMGDEPQLKKKKIKLADNTMNIWQKMKNWFLRHF